MKNKMNLKQFKGGYVPLQPSDPDNRAYRQEPNSPSRIKRRTSRGR